MAEEEASQPPSKQQRNLTSDSVVSLSCSSSTSTAADPTKGLGGPRDARDAGAVLGGRANRSRGRDWWKNRREKRNRDEEGGAEGSTRGSQQGEGAATRFPKRKVALLFCYSGKGYQGLQKNPGAKTIEDELESALSLTGCLPQECVGNLQKIQWQRCARTDKGVGALFQIVSAKLTLPASNEVLVERLNNYLPLGIRMVGIERVSKSFNAKLACHARTYEYMLPTFALLTDKTGPVFTEAVRARVQLVLDQFVGAHKFHNFTSGRPWWHESSRRTILSYQCSAPLTIDGIEFVTLTVKGNSFVLHHIRKMTALVVMMVRDDAPLAVVEAAFQPHPVCIHMAPAVGLLLRQAHFDQFFAMPEMRHLRGLEFPEAQATLEAFKVGYLLPEMVRQIREDGEFEEWVRVLTSFPLDYAQAIETSKLPPPPMPSKEAQQKKRDKLVADNGGYIVRTKASDDCAKKTFRAINPGWTNDSFAPVVQGQSLNYHFGKIYKGSIVALNNLVRTSAVKHLSLQELFFAEDQPPAVRNAAGDIFCHQLYWTSLVPRSDGATTPPSNQLTSLIAQQYGSFDAFRAKFTETAIGHFGSGWIWICADSSALSTTSASSASAAPSSSVPIVILSTHDSDLPARHLVPLMNLDVWEHAYYADFRNDRPRYVNEFWWPFADWTRGDQRLQLFLNPSAPVEASDDSSSSSSSSSTSASECEPTQLSKEVRDD